MDKPKLPRGRGYKSFSCLPLIPKSNSDTHAMLDVNEQQELAYKEFAKLARKTAERDIKCTQNVTDKIINMLKEDNEKKSDEIELKDKLMKSLLSQLDHKDDEIQCYKSSCQNLQLELEQANEKIKGQSETILIMEDAKEAENKAIEKDLRNIIKNRLRRQ